MDHLTLLLFISFIFFILFFIFQTRSSQSAAKNPPGPRPLPIIGNILELGTLPHQSLTNLSRTYGPVMTLKLGRTTTVVISSPQAAKEVLQKKDHAFSFRTIPDTIRAHDHDQISVVWMPPSSQWRVLKRICVTEVFSAHRLDSTQTRRQRKLQDLLNYVDEFCRNGEALDISDAVFTTVLNSISNTFFSMDLARYTSDKSQEFKDIIWGIMEEAGRPNVVDFFPVLRVLDPQRARSRMMSHFGKLFAFFDGLIEERLRFVGLEMEFKRFNDVLDSLMQLMMNENPQVSRPQVLHLFLDLFVAGIDTTSSTIEWAMAELLRNPEKMKIAKDELRQILREDEQLEEFHISRLPFLRAIVKETMRLHPSLPLLVPHKTEDEAELCGCFVVPKNAHVLINAWAIGRDPNVYDDPNQFKPERFMDNEIDFKGHDFELIPFGAGRRICPGLPLANRTVHIVLASLLYHYDWKNPNGFKAEDMDMSEMYGISLHKAIPLKAIPIKA
ncbi:geraniol 8-hydroxylase-like isoform X1 [Prosopis cineraria]|uniref:geraniol 8-hydroxylase-like isoform X1 n=2 Tax=Prosopis cineraria TaxID=364024 RepID=UPI00240F744F|nr:geraniol 8-hydroxylase-like isoform X1 [Prosopis cineraria]